MQYEEETVARVRQASDTQEITVRVEIVYIMGCNSFLSLPLCIENHNINRIVDSSPVGN